MPTFLSSFPPHSFFALFWFFFVGFELFLSCTFLCNVLSVVAPIVRTEVFKTPCWCILYTHIHTKYIWNYIHIHNIHFFCFLIFSRVFSLVFSTCYIWGCVFLRNVAPKKISINNMYMPQTRIWLKICTLTYI